MNNDRMNKFELTEYIAEIYSTDPDHPWASDPDNAVFRHAGNRKWFALIMDIPGARLNLDCGHDLHRESQERPGDVRLAAHWNREYSRRTT